LQTLFDWVDEHSHLPIWKNGCSYRESRKFRPDNSISSVQFFVPGNYLEIPWYNNCQFNFQQRCLTVMRKRFWSTINVQISQRSFDTKLKCWLQRNGLTNPGSGTSLVLKWQIFLIFWCTHNRFNLESNSCKENQVC
jgi:hypothetical protein